VLPLRAPRPPFSDFPRTFHRAGLLEVRGPEGIAMRGVRAAAVLAIAWAPLTLAGCKPARSGPPINAVLPRGWRYVSGEARLGDTTLLGRCEWRGSGSVATWYGGLYWDVASFDVLRVERGRWPHKKLTFDCRYYYYWSRSRSGDRSSRAPRPYQRDDDVWAFHLVTSRKPARIIGQQRRSYLPPHKKELVPCSLDFFKPADRRICDRVTAAVRLSLIHI